MLLTRPILLVLCASACTGVISEPGITGPGGEPTAKQCQLSADLQPPQMIAPTGGEFVQPSQATNLALSASQDAAGAVTQFEILIGDEEQEGARVWSGSTDSDQIVLSAGEFDLGFESLRSWSNYLVRARTQVRADDGSCSFSEWSPNSVFRVDDGSEAIFNEDEIRDIYIELPAESFTAINAEARPPGCVPYSRNYYPATVQFNGQTFENAGVRGKGGCGSARDLSGKSSFKINLSDYSTDLVCPESRRADGLKRITLNNQVQDQSFVHERIAYRYYELVGIPVPRRAPIRVHVNNLGDPNTGMELWGLYLHLESIDRRYLERRTDKVGAQGALYEGTYFCDMTPNNLPPENGPETCFGLKFASGCSEPHPEGDPISYAPLIDFITSVDAIPDGELYPAITQYLDFDLFLKQWAADAVLNHWDGSIFDILNNYRVYHNPVTDLWQIIPTGMDQSMNAGQRPINPWQPGNIVARRCLQEPACEDLFAAELARATEIFENAGFEAAIDNIVLQISQDVELDPRKESNNFSSRVEATKQFVRDRPEQIRTVLRNRGYL